jgi:hypothetical protein
MIAPRFPLANLSLIRSRTPPVESPTQAAARRRAEYDALVNPTAEQAARAARRDRAARAGARTGRRGPILAGRPARAWLFENIFLPTISRPFATAS